MTGSAASSRALPRDLHPIAWWSWAIGLATAASLTTNPLLLLLLMGSATVVVMARRSGHPFGRSFRLYVLLAVVTVVLRVVFRILFGGQEIGHVLLDLPEVPLPDWAAGVRLLGPITSEALLAGLYDGLRLATIILCVGAANSLANPKRLLASVPPALYEIGTALVVAVTIFPQLADSARRVHAAQALRGGATSGVGRLRRFLVPVLEDALERSLALAAGMDTRGYGRSGGASAARALGDGLAAAPRPDRHLRRDVRLARPDGPARAGAADAGRRRGRRGARPGQRGSPRAAHPLPPRPVAYARARHGRRRDRGRRARLVRRPHAGPRSPTRAST